MGSLIEFMKKSSKTKESIYHWISDEIRNAEKYGISVNVGGVNYTSDNDNELLLVLEDAIYMKEYLSDDSGKIVQINFDKVVVNEN